MGFRNARTEGPASLFEQVNAFVAHHMECSDVGEDLTYSIACNDSVHGRDVTVACRCGATASLPSTPEDAQALATIARMHDIPTQYSRSGALETRAADATPVV